MYWIPYIGFDVSCIGFYVSGLMSMYWILCVGFDVHILDSIIGDDVHVLDSMYRV